MASTGPYANNIISVQTDNHTNTPSQTNTHTHTDKHMECTVKYDERCHRWVRRWAISPIHDEQVLLHLSHGQTVPVVLMTCSLRAARFLYSAATCDSSNDAVANWHAVRNCARSNGAVLSDWGRRPHLFMSVSYTHLTLPTIYSV